MFSKVQTDRPAAISRMQGALAELVAEGVSTTVAAHRAIPTHPDFVAARHSTRFVEERIVVPDGTAAVTEPAPDPPVGVRSQEVEVAGRVYFVLRFESGEDGAAGLPGYREILLDRAADPRGAGAKGRGR